MKLMEREGAIREEIIDLKLFDLALNRYHEIGKKTIFTDNFFIADPNCMIDNLVQIKTKDVECFLAFLDNCQILLLDHNMKIIRNFTPLDQNKGEFGHTAIIWEYKSNESTPLVSITGEIQDNFQGKTKSNRQSIASSEKKTITEETEKIGDQEKNDNTTETTAIHLPREPATPLDRLSVSFLAERRAKRSSTELQKAKKAQSLEKKYPQTPAHNSMKKKSISPITPVKKGDFESHAQRAMHHGMSKLKLTRALNDSHKKIEEHDQEQENDIDEKNQKPSEIMAKIAKKYLEPDKSQVSAKEKGYIHEFFELFKKTSNEKSQDVARLFNKAHTNKEYDFLIQLAKKTAKRAEFQKNATGTLNNSAFVTTNSEDLNPLTIEGTIGILKKKFSKVNEDLSEIHDITNEKHIHALSRKYFPHKYLERSKKHQLPIRPKTAYIQDKYEGQAFKVYDKHTKKDKDFYCTCAKYDDKKNLMMIGLISREVRVYIPKQKYDKLNFFETYRLKFSTVPLSIDIGSHNVSHSDIMGILTEDEIYVFKVIKTTKTGDYGFVKEPFYKSDPVSHKMGEPLSIILPKTIGMIVAGLGGEIEIFEEEYENGVYFKLRKRIQSKSTNSNVSISVIRYSDNHKLIATGNTKGAVQLINPYTSESKDSFSKQETYVAGLHFLENEPQLLVVYGDKTITLLDLLSLRILQVMKDYDLHYPYDVLKTSIYIHNTETLIVAGSHFKMFGLHADPKLGLKKRDIDMKRHFAPQSVAKTMKAYKDYKLLFDANDHKTPTALDYEVFLSFVVESTVQNDMANKLVLVERSHAVKIFDLLEHKLTFGFVMELNDRIISASLSEDGKLLAAGENGGAVNLYNLKSGECIERLYTTKMEIHSMRFLPKESSCMIVCGDKEGRLALYKSFFKGKREKKNHDILVAHEKTITCMDLNHDFIATADERNEILIWSHLNFSFISTIKIPDHYEKSECMEFVVNDPHEKFEGESKISDIRFLKEANREHMLLVLENRGCIHILNIKDAKVFQMHAVNIGQFAKFDIDYEIMGTRLYSLDIDLRIRIFYKAEDVDINTFKEEQLAPLPVNKLDIANNIPSRKVTFAKSNDDSPEKGEREFRERTTTIKLNKAAPIVNLTPSTVGKRRKAIANRHKDDEVTLKREKESGNNWAFYLVKNIRHPLEGIPRGVEVKNISITFMKPDPFFITVLNYGNILIWNRSGDVVFSMSNRDTNDEMTSKAFSPRS